MSLGRLLALALLTSLGACASDSQPTHDLTPDARTDTAHADTSRADTSLTTTDRDDDGIPDADDNCPDLWNPNQEDRDHDGIGDLCDPHDDTPTDSDGDGIPDLADPFPTDSTRPGTVRTNTVYAHTATELHILDIKSLEFQKIANFRFPTAAIDQMTDIAIDRYGVLWGIGFNNVFVIEPTTAVCWRLASLPREFNGLTLISRTVLHTPTDALIGLDTTGGWWRLDLVPQQGTQPAHITLAQLGSLGAGWSSSGDAFSTEGVGTFVTADHKPADELDQLVRVDPATGQITATIASLAPYTQVYGLAGTAGRAFAFDAGGDVIVLDLSTGQIITTKRTGKPWWGAGVKTVLDAP